MTTVLDEKTIEILARVYGGLELTWVDDDVACAVTVGDLCATWTAAHETIPDVRQLLAGINHLHVASADGAGPHWFIDPAMDLLVQAVYLDEGLWCARWCRMPKAATDEGKIDFAVAAKTCGPWLIVEKK